MVRYAKVQPQEEVHKECIVCKGKNKSSQIIYCDNDECSNITHIKCQEKEFIKIYAYLKYWYCCATCGTNEEQINLDETEISSDESDENEIKKNLSLSGELKHEQEISRRDKQVQELMDMTNSLMERNKLLESQHEAYTVQTQEEIKALKEKITSLSEKIPEPEPEGPSHVNASQTNASVSEEPRMELDEKYERLVSEYSKAMSTPKIQANRDRSLLNRTQNPDAFASPPMTTDGHSNATIEARKRIRERREKDKNFSSWEPHANRTSQELALLKLARQHLDELRTFKGDRSEWIAFEEEVYTTWDAGQFGDFEMIKKLRKALDGDAKAYVKLALNSPNAQPEHVMETLRRKYYHPNEAVSAALKEITIIEHVRRKVRKPLENLLTAVENYIHTCRLVGIQQHLHGRVNGEVEAKLPPELRADWNKLIRTGVHHDNTQFNGNWTEFWQFLRDSVEDLPVYEFSASASTSTSFKKPFSRGGEKRTVNQTNTTETQKGRNQKSSQPNDKSECPYDNCERKKLYHCAGFYALPYESRLKFIKERKICQRCANATTHVAKDCPFTNLKCQVLGCENPKSHSSVLHNPKSVTMCIFQNLGFTAFQILPIFVFDRDDNPVRILAFLDGGSDTTIMNQSCLDLLGLESENYKLEVSWCAAGVSSVDRASRIFDCCIASIEEPERKFTLQDVVTMKNFSLPQQAQNAKFLKEKFPHLKKIPIPSYEHEFPQMLLGLQQKHLMTPDTVVKTSNCPIVAEHTSLGWTVSGSIRPRRDKRSVLQACLTRNDTRDELTLEELSTVIRKFLNEDISFGTQIEGGYLTSEEKRANELFEKFTKTSQNRVFVPLYWSSDDVTLPDNFPIAESRLIAQEIRLKKLNMVEWANNHIKGLIDSGFARQANAQDLTPEVPHKVVNYVPGFVTFNKNKVPPKPRWVGDPACRFRGTSLNTALLKGVDNLVPLSQALFHFRERKVAVVADVEKMFHQVFIIPEDQNAQRFLWRWCDTTKTPEIFIHQAMMFGPTDSPSKANAIRIKHATDNQLKYPDGSRVALLSMYMDDAFNSEDDVETALKVSEEIIQLFDEISWRLVDFRSNSKALLERLPADRVNENFAIDLAKDETVDKYKVLGIFWDPTRDAFIFKQTSEFELKAKTQNEGYTPTKREVLSFIMRIYDPLGIIAHFIVLGRMIMQKTWAADLDWNDKLTSEIQEMWIKWLNYIDSIAKLAIPRHYNYISTSVIDVSLHMFSDAGADGFSTVAYFRFKFNDGKVKIQHVAAKSKVSPIRYLSIAKKELSAAVASVNLSKIIRTQHKRLIISSTTYYTDSEVTLKWIRNPSLKLMQYVAPRVTQIWDETQIKEWRYVPTKENPADFGTKWNKRDIDYSDSNHVWFSGPDFLKQEILQYPADAGYPKSVNHKVCLLKCDPKEAYYLGVLEFIKPCIRADWNRYLAAIAGALRYMKNISLTLSRRKQEKNTEKFFSPDERKAARDKIILNLQRAYWPEQFKSLIEGHFVRSRSSADLNKLKPFIGEGGLIRNASKMSHDDSIPYDKKFPIIIPAKHEVTDAIIWAYHKKNHHIAHESVIAKIQETFWVLHTREAVRRVLAKCVICIEMRARPYKTPTAPLPIYRTRFNSKAFEHCGVDVFGHYTVYTRSSKHTRKVWGVIFTCLVTRGVLLRVINSLSADEMLLAIQDVWTRRGPISHMYSDNGTNFVGAAAILKDEHKKILSRQKGLQWHFNPPYTPHFGGAWERLIKDIKRAIKFTIGDKIVSERVFSSTMLQVEEIMNSRPLTHIPVSPFDNEPLTPNLLIKLHPGYPLVVNESGDLNAKCTLRQAQWYAEQIRRRWTREYLPIIARHPTKGEKAGSVKEGDYVMYIDPVNHHSNWKKGVVKNVYRGRDGIARVADIKLPDGSLLERRPARRLAKLDIDNDYHDKNVCTVFSQLLQRNLQRSFQISKNEPDNSFREADFPLSVNKTSRTDTKNISDEIFNNLIMKPTPEAAIRLAKKLLAMEFVSAAEIKANDNAEMKALKLILIEQQDPADKELKKTVKVVGFPRGTSIVAIICWFSKLGIKPSWIKIDNIQARKQHVFLRATDQMTVKDLLDAKSHEFEGVQIDFSKPRSSVDFIELKGFEHAVLTWSPSSRHRDYDILISRARSSEANAKAMPVLSDTFIEMLTLVQAGQPVEWDPECYTLPGEQSVFDRLGSHRANGNRATGSNGRLQSVIVDPQTGLKPTFPRIKWP